MGLDWSVELNTVLRQALTDNGMPFRVTGKNQLSAEARRQAEAHEGATFSSVDDLMRNLQNV
ncbi:hypothetical protein JS533_000555 [Bifidobacterium amazonense]|uniref:Uncharacterized protein n=1 Tax=Bifidobacterium amazonense TaxID=2809027 RepID=A0ABS9VRQ5_9BIFI|nr:hypothetical protein [Bifidobacterium amazonense]MCH9274785.1 hypothetical protein [Bifidobacterium amazonense]